MDAAEKAHVSRQKQKRVAYMPVEVMFPDKQVRQLAILAGKGKIKELDKLVSKGLDVNSLGSGGATPLFWSLKKGNIRGFNRLLELGANPNILFDGSSVLHWAAGLKDISFLQSALKYGGNPNLVAGKLTDHQQSWWLKRVSPQRGQSLSR